MEEVSCQKLCVVNATLSQLDNDNVYVGLLLMNAIIMFCILILSLDRTVGLTSDTAVESIAFLNTNYFVIMEPKLIIRAKR